MVNEIVDFITGYNKEVDEIIQAEYARQGRNLELITSRNIVSEPVMMAMGTVLTDKYAEGYSGRCYYGGCQCVGVVEALAIERAKKLSGCDYVSVQPHSGAQVNITVFVAMLKTKDTVMDMNLDHSGRPIHGSLVNFPGLHFNIVPYGINDQGLIDYDKPKRIAKKARPKLIIAGVSAYARTIDFKRFREIADKVGAYLMIDMAHTAGLTAAGEHPSPIPYTDVATTTAHKTLRGPRGGMILTNKEAAEKFNFNKAVFLGTQGGPLKHVTVGKAMCFTGALRPEFKTYQYQVTTNVKAPAQAPKDEGFEPLTDGTDNHLILVDLRGTEMSDEKLQGRCDEVYITLNKNTIPNDPGSPFVTSGVRTGTPATTTEGLKEGDMPEIARYIWLAVTGFENKADYIRNGMTKFCERYPIYQQIRGNVINRSKREQE